MRKWLSLFVLIVVLITAGLVLLERKASTGRPDPVASSIEIDNVLDQ